MVCNRRMLYAIPSWGRVRETFHALLGLSRRPWPNPPTSRRSTFLAPFFASFAYSLCFQTSPSTTLTYLTSQIVYLGSHMGNSQLLRINPVPVSDVDIPTLPVPACITTVPPARLMSSAKGKEKAVSADDMDIVEDESVKIKDKTKKGCVIQNNGVFLSVLDTFKNIAPIMDAILVDADGTGQVESYHRYSFPVNRNELTILCIAPNRYLFWWPKHRFDKCDPNGG